MPSRAELELRAANAGVDASTYANDSKLEQKVIYEEKLAMAVTGAKATGTLTSTGTAPANNDTVVIGSKTYTFKTTLTGAADEVLIGASAAAALDNIKSAINATAGAGTTYGTGTVAHSQVDATTNTDTTQVVESKNVGDADNNIATTETSAQLSWGSATLTGGTDTSFTPAARSVQAISGGANV